MKDLTGVPGGICKFDECGLPYYSLSYCIGHYRQHKNGRGMKPLRPRREPTFSGRFWTKVEKTETCWLWTGGKTDGYGRISVNGDMQLAHRLTFSWENGPIPDGMVVDHRCHQRNCVRPEHLRLATAKQNTEHRLGATRLNILGIRGVSKNPYGKYSARVSHNKEKYHVGTFATAEEAEAAVVAKRIELFTHNDLDRI